MREDVVVCCLTSAFGHQDVGGGLEGYAWRATYTLATLQVARGTTGLLVGLR